MDARMEAMNNLDGASVLAALKEEAAACGELSGLRAEQRRLIESGEAEALLEVLAGRKRPWPGSRGPRSGFGRCGPSGKPARQPWPRRSAWPSAMRLSRCGSCWRN